MAYRISDYTRPVGTSSDYPSGDIKDNPSGTLVNRKMLSDIIQTIFRAMRLAGITPSGNPDNVTNGYQVAKAFGLEAWDSFTSLSAATSGGGSISAGTVAYSKYKITGKTLKWQVRFINATISGSPTTIVINSPMTSIFTPTSANFPADGLRLMGVYNNGSANAMLVASLNGPTGFGQITLTTPGGFTNGTTNQSFFLDIECELP